MKTFNIGNERSLKLSNNEIIVVDKRTKTVVLKSARLRLRLDEIDNQLHTLSHGDLKTFC